MVKVTQRRQLPTPDEKASYIKWILTRFLCAFWPLAPVLIRVLSHTDISPLGHSFPQGISTSGMLLPRAFFPSGAFHPRDISPRAFFPSAFSGFIQRHVSKLYTGHVTVRISYHVRIELLIVSEPEMLCVCRQPRVAGWTTNQVVGLAWTPVSGPTLVPVVRPVSCDHTDRLHRNRGPVFWTWVLTNCIVRRDA